MRLEDVEVRLGAPSDSKFEKNDGTHSQLHVELWWKGFAGFNTYRPLWGGIYRFVSPSSLGL